MATWTTELKEKAFNLYKEADPTPATSTEIIKEIAEELNQSPNGVRQVLVQAGLYVKKDVASEPTTSTTKPKTGTTRVSKESLFDSLKEAIKAKGGDVDDDIISKLTGKAAAYFTSIIAK